jgi:hypothetical protein
MGIFISHKENRCTALCSKVACVLSFRLREFQQRGLEFRATVVIYYLNFFRRVSFLFGKRILNILHIVSERLYFRFTVPVSYTLSAKSGFT